MSGSASPLINWHPGVGMNTEAYVWLAGTTPNGASIITLPGYAAILAVTGWISAAESGAASIQPVRVPSGSTVAQGVALCSAFNVGSTATGGVATLTPTQLAQFNTTQSLKLLPGDTIAIQSTGSFSASAGNITFYWIAQ